MRKILARHGVVAVLVLSVVLLCVPNTAWAHAVLVHSTPAANTAVGAGALDVVLTFNSRVDPVRSSLSVLEPDGKVVKLTMGTSSSADILSAKASVAAKGVYKLRWQALSSDGHITRGEIPFTVR